MKIFRIICKIKGIWRSKYLLWNWSGFPIDGCDYVEQKNGDLICKICGKKDYPNE